MVIFIVGEDLIKAAFLKQSMQALECLLSRLKPVINYEVTT